MRTKLTYEKATLEEPRAFMKNLDTEHPTDVPENLGDEDESRYFEGTVTAEEVALSGSRDNLLEVQRVCKSCGKAVATTIIEGIKLACGDIEAKRKNTTLLDR